jgi:hypothetical protein
MSDKLISEWTGGSEVPYLWHADLISYVKGKVVPVLNLIKHYAMKAYGGWMYRSTFSW